jgi:hypothetical protein
MVVPRSPVVADVVAVEVRDGMYVTVGRRRCNFDGKWNRLPLIPEKGQCVAFFGSHSRTM